MVAKRQEGGSGMYREMQTIALEWISSEVLLYITGDHIQSCGIEHDGREYEKRIYIYMYVCVCVYVYTHIYICMTGSLLYGRNWHNTINQL